MSNDIKALNHAVVKALVTEDWVAYDSLKPQKVPTTLIGAALVALLRRRFSTPPDPAAVIRLVAETRATAKGGAEIPPAGAEALVLGMLGVARPQVQETMAAMSLDEVIETEIYLLTKLVKDEEFTGEQLDAFLVQAQALSDQMITALGEQPVDQRTF